MPNDFQCKGRYKLSRMVEASLTIFHYSKRQVYYRKRVVNEFCCVAGFLRFTFVDFAVVSCVGNSGNMKGKFTIVNLNLQIKLKSKFT